MSPNADIQGEGEVELKVAEQYFINSVQTYDFRDESVKNAVVGFENNFNNVCAALETAGHLTKNITTMELYAKLTFFNSQNKPK